MTNDAHDTLATTREQIKQFAAEAFAEHRLQLQTSVDEARVYRCAKPGAGVYAFTVVILPNAVVFYGDVGEAILRMSAGRAAADTLAWLCGAVRSERYLLEKQRPPAEECFYRADAHAWLDEQAKDLAESDKAFEDEADLRACLDDECCSPNEFARELSKAGLLDGDIPGMGPSAASLWLVEALRWFSAHVDEVQKGGVA